MPFQKLEISHKQMEQSHSSEETALFGVVAFATLCVVFVVVGAMCASSKKKERKEESSNVEAKTAAANNNNNDSKKEETNLYGPAPTNTRLSQQIQEQKTGTADYQTVGQFASMNQQNLYSPVPLNTNQQQRLSSNLANNNQNARRPQKSSSELSLADASVSKWQIQFKELELVKKIGAGNFGEVYKGVWRGSEVAVKKLTVTNSTKANTEFLKELAVMLAMRPHENVIMLKGFCVEPRCIVTQFVAGGDLLTWLQKRGSTADLLQLVTFCQGTATGLLHLHEEGIVHRDLAARNILVSEAQDGWDAVITDMGMSRVMEETGPQEEKMYVASVDHFPLKWTSPESLKDKKFTHKSDVWSYGCVCIEIFDSGKLYPNFPNRQEIVNQVAQGKLTPPIPSTCPDMLVSILEECFVFDANKRLSMAEICKRMNGVKLYASTTQL